MPYERTAIRSLHIRGYRSLVDVALRDLPDTVVMLGPNGAGKSNLLRAVRLVLRAIGSPRGVSDSRAQAVLYDAEEAETLLGLNAHDFRVRTAASKEIRIRLSVNLGTRACEAVDMGDQPLGVATLEGVFQDVGAGTFKVWFEEASIRQRFSLMPNPASEGLRQQIRAHEGSIAALDGNIEQQRNLLAQVGSAQSPSIKSTIRSLETQRDQALANISGLRRRLSVEELNAERVRSFMANALVQTSDAYRRPSSVEPELFRILLSRDASRRAATRRLSQLLGRASLLGSQDSVDLLPVEPRSVLVGGNELELPLENLGTGQQQILLMLAQRVITPAPIAHLEEPEAHLHKNLMRPLADLLRQSTGGERPELDQLWIATHHHLFAIADDFCDVSLDPRTGTAIRARPRAEAIEHFYEPSPYWDALESLVSDGLKDDEVLSLDESGKSLTVRDVRDSLRGDRKIADQFVAAALRSVLLSIAPKP